METSPNHALIYQSAFREYVRWGDIPDCKRYKELLESPDKEVVTMAIELLKLDGVDDLQIEICEQRFLNTYRWKWAYDLYENKT